MLRWFDWAAGFALLGIGVLHVIVGGGVFAEPSARGVWFVSAGFLGIAAGFANLARIAARRPSRLACLSALVGSAGVATVGVLLAAAGEFRIPDMPASLVLFAGLVSTAFALVHSVRAFGPQPNSRA